MKREMKYIVYQEGKYFVSQCLNADVSSFGKTIEEATRNLVEAVELYVDDRKNAKLFVPVKSALIGEHSIDV